MFELAKYSWCCTEWPGSLARLDGKPFTMQIASASSAATRNPGKLILICSTTSDLFRPSR